MQPILESVAFDIDVDDQTNDSALDERRRVAARDALQRRWPDADVAVRFVEHGRGTESYLEINDPDGLDNGDLAAEAGDLVNAALNTA